MRQPPKGGRRVCRFRFPGRQWRDSPAQDCLRRLLSVARSASESGAGSSDMNIAHDIMARLYGKPIPPEKQRLLERLAKRVNDHRQQKKTTIKPDAAAYMDAHRLPEPRF